jgi:hypothetical protein
MPVENAAPVVTPENGTPVAPVVFTPPAPVAPKPAPPAAPVTFTQAEVNAFLTARLERADAARGADMQKLTEQVTALTAQGTKAEARAVKAIVAKAAALAHNPAQVASLVDLGELTSADAEAIETKVAEFLTANPYFINAAAPSAPNLTPAPGVTSTTAVGTAPMSAAEMDAVTPAQLAADDALYARYENAKRVARGAAPIAAPVAAPAAK